MASYCVKPTEAPIVRRILKYLRAQGGWWQKTQGWAYQGGGMPDIIGCFEGRFLGLEVKTPHRFRRADHGISQRQAETLQRLTDAGGLAVCVCSVDQVKEVLARARTEAGDHRDAEGQADGSLQTEQAHSGLIGRGRHGAVRCQADDDRDDGRHTRGHREETRQGAGRHHQRRTPRAKEGGQ